MSDKVIVKIEVMSDSSLWYELTHTELPNLMIEFAEGQHGIGIGDPMGHETGSIGIDHIPQLKELIAKLESLL